MTLTWGVQAEHLFTPKEYETTLLFVLDHCAVDTATLDQINTLSQASLEDRRLNLKMSRMTVIQGRPRLRDRVTSELKTEERRAQVWRLFLANLVGIGWTYWILVIQVDTQLDTWDSYTGFCYKHQFPPTLSERVKSRLYFLASQTQWDWQPYIERVLPSGGPVCEKVAAHPIAQPDLQVLLRVIEGLSMDGSPPFSLLSDFRKECFQSFPVTHQQRMTLSQVRCERAEERGVDSQCQHTDTCTEKAYGFHGRHAIQVIELTPPSFAQILQLYVAAFQAPCCWKEVWKSLVGVISVQIIRDVETFVVKHPFAHADVMRFVVAS